MGWDIFDRIKDTIDILAEAPAELKKITDEFKEDMGEMLTDGFMEMVVKGNSEYKTSYDIKKQGDELVDKYNNKLEKQMYKYDDFIMDLEQKYGDYCLKIKQIYETTLKEWEETISEFGMIEYSKEHISRKKISNSDEKIPIDKMYKKDISNFKKFKLTPVIVYYFSKNAENIIRPQMEESNFIENEIEKRKRIERAKKYLEEAKNFAKEVEKAIEENETKMEELSEAKEWIEKGKELLEKLEERLSVITEEMKKYDTTSQRSEKEKETIKLSCELANLIMMISNTEIINENGEKIEQSEDIKEKIIQTTKFTEREKQSENIKIS